MIRHAAALCAATLLPAGLAAQEVYVDDPSACARAEIGTPQAAMTIRGEDNMLLFAEGMEAIEYSCTFDAPIVFDWSETSTQIRPGYCAEPGEYIYPQVFVVGMSEYEPGVALVWGSGDSTGEAQRFYACSMQ